MRSLAASAALLLLLAPAAIIAAAPLGRVGGTAGAVPIAGEEVRYLATPGTIELRRSDGQVRGSIFYTAYRRTGVDAGAPAARPIAFIFNGGPGSSSAWLHLGAFGPRRVELGDSGLSIPPAPHRTATNPHSLIDVADLVFIDPIGTGFSRARDLLSARSFFGFRGDVRAIAEFIKRYLTEVRRANSPIFLIGESYGAMRACGLAPELEEEHGIVVNGVVLISGPIVMGERFPPDLALPTAAATAHYHGLLAPELQALDREQLLAKVGAFADGDYRTTLDGDNIDAETRERVARQVRAFTGLQRLRGISFSLREVRVNAIRQLGVESIGLYDTRVTTSERSGIFRGAIEDPAIEVIREPMAAVMQDYLTRELGHETDLSYELINRIPMWSHAGSKASDTLTRALQTNRGLQVLVACGYYDTVTPMAVVRKAVEDARIAPDQRKNIRFENYEGGHMIYTNLPSLKKLSTDVRKFIRESAKRERGPALIPTATTSQPAPRIL